MKQSIGRSVLKLLKWSIIGDIPTIDKAVLPIAPHTSERDWLYLLMAGWAIGRGFRYMVRDDVWASYRRLVLQPTGAFPLNPSESMVETSVRYLTTADEMLLAISPEGALRRMDAWRTGFYYIAHRADVPLVPIGLDYARQAVVIGRALRPSGDIHADVAQLASFYTDIQGRHPEQVGPVRVDTP